MIDFFPWSSIIIYIFTQTLYNFVFVWFCVWILQRKHFSSDNGVGSDNMCVCVCVCCMVIISHSLEFIWVWDTVTQIFDYFVVVSLFFKKLPTRTGFVYKKTSQQENLQLLSQVHVYCVYIQKRNLHFLFVWFGTKCILCKKNKIKSYKKGTSRLMYFKVL